MLDPIRPGAIAHVVRRAAMNGRSTSWLGPAWRPGPAKEAARDAGTGSARRAQSRRGHHAQLTRALARGRARELRGGGWPAARCCR
jgi:hypothetical protein